MKDSLFKEFSEVSAGEWKQKIQADLKGADYEQKLVFKSLDDIAVQPIYTSEDINEEAILPPSAPWSICEKIKIESAAHGNKKIKNALEKGAESLWLLIASRSIKPEELFSNIDLQKIQVIVNFQFLSFESAVNFDEYLEGKAGDYFLQTDIFGNLTQTGSWFFDQKRDIKTLISIYQKSSGCRSVINVDTSIYQNAGANIPQQLAYSLAHMNEYINLLQQKGEDLSQFHPQFVTSTGSNYFFEIAKLRALRLLYKTLAREHQLPEDCSILAQPTFRNKTLYDYNVNLLRSTTECMSAVLGGANFVSNLPYDLLFHKSSEFGERIARNQLLIMKHEAYLSKVANPTDGAYYIESLTSQFAQTALDLFKEIEDDGGFLKLLLNGNIQKAIKESAAREQEMFDRGELVLIGTNKFQNLQDSVKEQLEVNPFEPKEITGKIIEPVRPVRLSESLERERMQKEQDQPTEC